MYSVANGEKLNSVNKTVIIIVTKKGKKDTKPVKLLCSVDILW